MQDEWSRQQTAVRLTHTCTHLYGSMRKRVNGERKHLGHAPHTHWETSAATGTGSQGRPSPTEAHQQQQRKGFHYLWILATRSGTRLSASRYF